MKGRGQERPGEGHRKRNTEGKQWRKDHWRGHEGVLFHDWKDKVNLFEKIRDGSRKDSAFIHKRTARVPRVR